MSSIPIMLSRSLASLSSLAIMGEFPRLHYLFSPCLNNSTLDTMMFSLSFVCHSLVLAQSDRTKLSPFYACSPFLPYFLPHSGPYYPWEDNPGHGLTSLQVHWTWLLPAGWQCPTKRCTLTRWDKPTRACSLGHSPRGPTATLLGPRVLTPPRVLTWDGFSLAISEHANHSLSDLSVSYYNPLEGPMPLFTCDLY